jgi:hypothetical protein
MIPVEAGDVGTYTSAVEQIANATIQKSKSKELIVVKIDNWFGSRWLDFRERSWGWPECARKDAQYRPSFLLA